MKLAIGILTTLMTLAYPFCIYYGSQIVEPQYLTLCFAFLFLLRGLTLGSSQLNVINYPIYILIISICLGSFLLNRLSLMAYIPSLISLTLLALFAHSLQHPPSLIEKFARRENPNLPKPAVIYCTWVTKIWCGFFIINASIAAYYAFFEDLKKWALYTGFYSYFLIAILFALEFGVRLILKPRFDRHTVTEESV